MSTAVKEGHGGCPTQALGFSSASHHRGPYPDVASDLELPSLSHCEPSHLLAFTSDPTLEEVLPTENRLRY